MINTGVKSFYKVLSHNYSLCKMVVELRSGSKINHNNNETSATTVTTEKKSTRDQNGADEHSKMTSVVFIGLLLDLLAFTLILPLFPSLLDHYKKNDGPDGLFNFLDTRVKSFGIWIGVPEGQFNSVLFGGLLGSLFSFLQFVASPLIGGLSDHFGRRPLLLLSTTGVALSYALWVNASTFSLFVLARIVGGLSKGNVSLATAIITDVSTPKTRQKGKFILRFDPLVCMHGKLGNVVLWYFFMSKLND